MWFVLSDSIVVFTYLTSFQAAVGDAQGGEQPVGGKDKGARCVCAVQPKVTGVHVSARYMNSLSNQSCLIRRILKVVLIS